MAPPSSGSSIPSRGGSSRRHGPRPCATGASISRPRAGKTRRPRATALFIRRMPSAIWETAPAIVVPTPILLFGDAKPGARMAASMSYTLLMIDRDYVARELLPSLAERHFGHAPRLKAAAPLPATTHATTGAALDFKVAVVSRSTPPDVCLSVHAVVRSRPRRAGRRDRGALPGPHAGLSAARRRGPPLHGIRQPAAWAAGGCGYSPLLDDGDDRVAPDVDRDYTGTGGATGTARRYSDARRRGHRDAPRPARRRRTGSSW